MATTFLKKTMVYLGLVDDEYDEYDEYEARSPVGAARPAVRRAAATDAPDEAPERPAPVGGGGAIRTFPRDERPSVTSQPAQRSASVRPVVVEPATKVHVAVPIEFADAQDIADRMMANQPVIVNLQSADRDLSRRMIDFCSGVAYTLSGGMEKVADDVFLLTPTNVKVSDEERQRLQERGLVNP